MHDRLQGGPCVWMTFDDLYRSRQSTNRALKRLVTEGLAECVGVVNFRGEGGNCYVYAAPGVPIHRNQMRHDVIAYRVILTLGLPFLSGGDVDPELLPDFETHAGVVVCWEIDSGATTYREIVEERYAKYLERPETAVWVSCGLWSTGDATRMQGLRQRAAGMPQMWFTTLQNVLDCGLEAVLVNCDGAKTAVKDIATDPESASHRKDAE